MTELRTAHTADLGAAELAAIRSLMDAAFDRVRTTPSTTRSAACTRWSSRTGS